MTTTTPVTPSAATTAERMFPRLTPAQSARVAAHGRTRPVRAGEVLSAAGDPAAPFLLVLTGEIESVRRTADGEELVALHGPGQFTGEVNLLAGRLSLVQSRVRSAGELVELYRERLLALVQTDAEIGEIVMRAFILRRVELMARGSVDVIVIGSRHCAGTLRVKEFLTRNVHPFTYVDLDHERDVQAMFDRFGVTGADLPAETLADARWPHSRTPYLLETSRPGVFAVGDVRAGNVKRVASAVGEGSIAISFVHRVLAE